MRQTDKLPNPDAPAFRRLSLKTIASRPSAQGKFAPLQALLLIVLTLAVYWPTLHSGFVYDATIQVLTDPFIHTPSNWGSVLSFRVLGMDVLDFDRPVHLMGLMLDAAVWGTNPFGYHLTSILLHAANTALLFFLIGKLFSGAPAAGPAIVAPFLCALFFSIHPIMAETVCEPTYREDLLVSFFSLAAMLLALGHKDPAGGADLIRASLIAAACLLAVGSKGSGVAAPILILSCWLLLRRKDRPAFWIVAVGTGLFLVAVFTALRFHLEPQPSVIFEHKAGYPGGSFSKAMELLPRILVLYLQNLVWPPGLCADYGILSIAHLNPLFCIVLLLVLAAPFGVAMRGSPLLILAMLVLVLPLLPVANLIPIFRPAADRYLYFPMAGVSLTLACFLNSRPLKARRAYGIAAASALAAALFLFGWMNVDRQRAWHDSLALWQDTLKKNPNSDTAAAGLGDALRLAGRLQESEKYFCRALRLTGGKRAETLMMRAVVLEGLGLRKEAEDFLEMALDRDPRLADPDSRIAALAMTQDEAAAIQDLVSRHPHGSGGRIRIDIFTDQLPNLPVNIGEMKSLPMACPAEPQ